MSSAGNNRLWPAIEDVVVTGTPRRFVSLVAVEESPCGRYAAALVLLNADSTPYPMVSLCARTEEGWIEEELTEASGNGCAQVRGVWCCYAAGQVEPGATARVQYAGFPPRTARSTPSGWYFAAVWPADGPCGQPLVSTDRLPDRSPCSGT